MLDYYSGFTEAVIPGVKLAPYWEVVVMIILFHLLAVAIFRQQEWHSANRIITALNDLEVSNNVFNDIVLLATNKPII